MKTTKQYVADLRAAMQRKGLSPSKYRLARELGVSELTVTYWEKAGRTMDDESATRAAEYLGIEPGEILIAMAYERAKSAKVRSSWERAAKALAGTAVALLVSYTVTNIAFDITEITDAFDVRNIHYTHVLLESAPGNFSPRSAVFWLLCAFGFLSAARIYSARSR